MERTPKARRALQIVLPESVTDKHCGDDCPFFIDSMPTGGDDFTDPECEWPMRGSRPVLQCDDDVAVAAGESYPMLRHELCLAADRRIL